MYRPNPDPFITPDRSEINAPVVAAQLSVHVSSSVIVALRSLNETADRPPDRRTPKKERHCVQSIAKYIQCQS
jgi:hypothetical protein